MEYYIGADLGTSALKLILTDEHGKIINTVSESYDVSYPMPGYSEQKPEDWWNALISGLKKLTSFDGADKIKGISVAGQMHGLVMLDKDDRVIRPAILWNDGRSTDETDYLNNTVGKEKLSRLTANIAFPGFTAPKILWVKNNESENFDKISKIMLPKDYITYMLTGVFATDFSDAGGMLLMDVENKCWSEEMLKICGISKDMLPELYESFDKVGCVKPDTAKLLGLPENVTVAAGAGDNAAAAIGTGCVGNGRCNISIGTSGTVFISSDSFGVDKNNALHSFCHADGGYHLMGCMLSAASCNKWFCEDILQTTDFAAEQKNIADEALGRNHVYFLPYLMGERSPFNDVNARGTFLGMRADTKREDMMLAVLEGVAFGIRDSLEVARSLGIDIKRSTLCGGGAKSPLWRKIFANVLNLELTVPVSEEGPGYGAAILAMVADGKYKSVSECSEKFFEAAEVIKPVNELTELYEKKYRKFKLIYPALKNVFASSDV